MGLATEADGSGEGDCPAVEKFEPTGLLLGNGLNRHRDGLGQNSSDTGRRWQQRWRVRPAFVFAVLFVPARAFVPICVVPVELPLEPASPGAAPPVIPPV